MKENFSIIMKFILYWEQYLSEDPQEPGGITVWGICMRDHSAEVSRMLSMHPGDAKHYALEIYRREYWDKIGGDELKEPMDMVLMNIAVNQGVGMAKKIAEAAVDWRDAIILALDRYDDLRSYTMYGRGWSRRLVSLRDYIVSRGKILESDRKEFVNANISY